MNGAVDKLAMYVLIGLVLGSGIWSSAWLVSLKAIDPSVFATVVGASVAGVVALLNPQFPKPPAV